MANIDQERIALTTRIRDGGGSASPAQRRSAFDLTELTEPLATLLHKVARRAYEVTDDDVAAARGAGLDEDPIFELVVCAAVGEANRQYETAIAALRAAGGQE